MIKYQTLFIDQVLESKLRKTNNKTELFVNIMKHIVCVAVLKKFYIIR